MAINSTKHNALVAKASNDPQLDSFARWAAQEITRLRDEADGLDRTLARYLAARKMPPMPTPPSQPDKLTARFTSRVRKHNTPEMFNQIMSLMQDGVPRGTRQIGDELRVPSTDRKRRQALHNIIFRMREAKILITAPGQQHKAIPDYRLNPAHKGDSNAKQANSSA